MADEFRHKVICDPVHGEIPVSRVEQQLIDSPSFQRLRHLKQLGLASLVYPNATHTRFAHSLGVFRITSRVIDLLVRKDQLNVEDQRKLRIAALLHDVGHYPYSHLMEFLDRDKYRPAYLAGEPGIEPSGSEPERYPDHEKIGQLVIGKREDITSTLNRAGIDPDEIASIIRSEHPKPAYNRLIHSSLDMDRMDYLVRDSLGTGVPYGRIDLDYLLGHLDVADDGDVVVNSKAATAVEHFLVARYFMYKAVYMHKTTFGFEALLRHILFLMRRDGVLYKDGKEVGGMVLTDEFLNFHDGYVDRLVQEHASRGGGSPSPLVRLCRALQQRRPPKLLHEVAVLSHGSRGLNAEYALFRQNRVDKIRQMSARHDIPVEFWIWEDPKDVSFESLSPFVPLAEAADVTPEETAELIRIRSADGSIRRLVDDPHSIIHHLTGYPEPIRDHKLFSMISIGEKIMPEQKASCQTRKRYKTDVTDDQWALVEGLIPPAVAKAGREPTDLREILNTILYQNHTGCQWDMLPHDLCPRSTTYDYYKAWQDQGVWGLLVDTLRGQIRVTTPRVQAQSEGPAGVEAGREESAVVAAPADGPAVVGATRAETPSFVIMDSQSAKVPRVAVQFDPCGTQEGLSVIPLGHHTYLKAKAKGENSMCGKAGYDETAWS